MGVSEDGANDETCSHSDTELADFGALEPETRPEIYVSIFDPVGEPAFKPSKTKPLPKWMQLLPNNVHRQREDQRSKASECKEGSQLHELQVLENTCQESHLDSGQSFRDNSRGASKDTTPGYAERGRPTPSLPVDIPGQSKQRATINFDPGAKRDHNFEGFGISRRSQNTGSTYITPPEYPPLNLPVPPRQRTPFPRSSRPSLERSPTSSYFSRSISTSEARDPSYCALEITSSVEASSTTPPIYTTPITGVVSKPWEPPILTATHSSEYIDKYRPTTSRVNIERYVAKDPEPILEKIRRQKMAEATEDKKGVGLASAKAGDGADRRRHGLHQELRNLFREE